MGDATEEEEEKVTLANFPETRQKNRHTKRRRDEEEEMPSEGLLMGCGSCLLEASFYHRVAAVEKGKERNGDDTGKSKRGIFAPGGEDDKNERGRERERIEDGMKDEK